MEELIGKKCRLLRPLRDPRGNNKAKGEIAIPIRIVDNLGRKMILMKFSDETTSFLFPDEIELVEDNG